MNKVHERLILTIIKENLSLDPLLNAGLVYSQIVKLIRDLQNRNLVVENDERLILSDEGEVYLKTLSERLKEEDKTAFIQAYKIDTESKSDVYLPPRKKK